MTVKRGVGQGFGFGIGCLLLGIVIVVGLAVAISAPTGNVATTPPPTRLPAAVAPTAAASPATTDPAASPTTPEPTVVPPEPAVLLSLHGTGIQRTAKFTAPGDWTISYSYDCTNFGQAGILQVYVYNADGTLEDVAVNALGEEGSGSQPEYTPGSFYLEVNSVCDWIVAAKG